jgi:hypothetical protein
MAVENTETKRSVLDQTNFGARVAEEEVDELAEYFVETDSGSACCEER